MMILFCVAIVLDTFIIQRFTDASIMPPFDHYGPPFHGPPLMHGPPPMHGPPLHDPLYMPPSHMKGPIGPVLPPEFMHGPLRMQKHHPLKYARPMISEVFRPLPSKFARLPPKPLMSRPLYENHGTYFPTAPNSYGYRRQMMRPRPNVVDGDLGYDSNSRYQFDNLYSNSYDRSHFNTQRGINQGRHEINRPSQSYVASSVGNTNNYQADTHFNAPPLREVIDTSNRRDIRMNSIESRKNSVKSVRGQSSSKSKQKSKVKGRSTKTTKASKSTVISSNKNVGTETFASNLLDKSKTGVQSKKVNVKKERTRGNKKVTRKSSVTTQIGTKPPKIAKTTSKAPTKSHTVKTSKNTSGLGGAVIDLSHMGETTGTTASKKIAKPKGKISRPVAKGAKSSGSPAPSTITANAAAANVAADANMKIFDPATNLGHLLSNDLAFIDKAVGNAVKTPAEVAASVLPASTSSPGGVVDLAASSGALSGANIQSLGSNVDVLTLDKQSFAQLENALQSGQAVDAHLLESILGRPTAAKGTLNAGPLASGGTADVGIASAAGPQIYFLDNAQAEHLASSTAFSGSPQTLDSHATSSSSTSSSKKTSQSTHKSSSTSISSNPKVDIPHAGKVLPSGHGHSIPGGHASHGIVGMVGKPVGHITVEAGQDIRHLFSGALDANNIQNLPASVASIPPSIAERMSVGNQHMGQGSIHLNSPVDMSNPQGHFMPGGHEHSGQGTNQQTSDRGHGMSGGHHSAGSATHM